MILPQVFSSPSRTLSTRQQWCRRVLHRWRGSTISLCLKRCFERCKRLLLPGFVSWFPPIDIEPQSNGWFLKDLLAVIYWITHTKGIEKIFGIRQAKSQGSSASKELELNLEFMRIRLELWRGTVIFHVFSNAGRIQGVYVFSVDRWIPVGMPLD